MRSVCVGFALAALLIGECLGAQVTLGARGGVARARQVDRNGPTSLFTGVNVGAVVVIDYSSWLSFQEEVTYAQKGWRQGDVVVALDYLEIPVLARLAVPVTGFRGRPDMRLQPFMVAGVTGATLLNCASSVSGSSPETVRNLEEEELIPADCSVYPFAGRDFSLLYGVGLSLQVRRRQVTAEVRRTMGINNLRTGLRAQGCQCGRGWLINDVVSVLVGTSFTLPTR